MADITFTARVDDVQLARLQKALSELQQYTTRDCFQSVMYASVKVAASARAYAKPGEKLRKVIVNPEHKIGKRNRGLMTASRFAGYPFMFPIDTQDRPRFWWYTFDRNDRKRKVPRHGLSKIMWNNLSAAAADQKGPTHQATKFTNFLSQTSPTESMAQITNLLSYEEEAYPGITNVAVTNGTSALNFQINKVLGITVDRANRP